MNFKSFGLSDVGVKRKSNEDSFLIDEDLGLAIVCDGVSGNQAAAFASESCVQHIRDFIRERRQIILTYQSHPSSANRTKVVSLIKSAVQNASIKIYEEAAKDIHKRGSCTTAEVLLWTKDYVFLGHVGDSRIYLVRDKQAHQLTEDHKFSIEGGKQNSPYANMLTRAVGIQKYVEVDVLQLEIRQEDLFLLCSDGLSDYLKPDELLNYSTYPDLSRLPQSLVNVSNERGGRDNITAVVIKVEGDAPKEDALDILKKSNLLGKVPLFKYLTFPELTKVLNLVKIKKFPAKSEIIHEGAPGGAEMFIIERGSVEITKEGQFIAKRVAGESIGEMALFDKAKRSATVCALEEATVMELRREELMELMRHEAQIAVKILWAINQELNQRLRTATDELVEAKQEVPFVELEMQG